MGYRLAVCSNALAVRFHFQLLQEIGQQAQALSIGHHRPRRSPQAVAVEDMRQPQQDRRVALQGRDAEVVVHRRSAGQKVREDLRPQADGAAQADSRPHRVAAAHPVTEAEHLIIGNAKCAGFLERRRDGRQML